MPVNVVTGASRGIGFELVRQLIERGDTVVAAARNPATSKALVELQKAHRSKLHLIELDVEKPETIKAAAAALEKKFSSGINVLINNAGVAGTSVRASEETEDNIAFVHKVNVLGPFLVTQAMLPLLRKGNRKLVANVSSGAGSLSSKVTFVDDAEKRKIMPFATQVMAYKMSKAALNMQTLSLAADLKDEGITLISYCPGWVNTDMGNGGRDLLKAAKPTWSAEDSVRHQLTLIDGATLEKSGRYFQHTGEVKEW